MKNQISRGAVGFTALLAMPIPEFALAHVTQSDHGSFGVGFGHPFSGIDHILVMVAVGIWAAQSGRPAAYALPVVFPLIMAVGASIGLVGVPPAAMEAGIALSAVALGAAILLKYRAKLRVAVPLVVVCGLLHGQAHGAGLPPGQNALLYCAGLIVGTGLLHAAGIAFGLMHRRRSGLEVPGSDQAKMRSA
jgi:urease accessory protein